MRLEPSDLRHSKMQNGCTSGTMVHPFWNASSRLQPKTARRSHCKLPRFFSMVNYNIWSDQAISVMSRRPLHKLPLPVPENGDYCNFFSLALLISAVRVGVQLRLDAPEGASFSSSVVRLGLVMPCDAQEAISDIASIANTAVAEHICCGLFIEFTIPLPHP